MPNYKAHLAGGAATFILILATINKLQITKIATNQILLYLTFCLFGSVFPDIDTKSKIQKYLYLFLFLTIIVTILFKNWILLSLLSFIAFIPLLVNHRGLTHKLWFIITIPFAIPILIFSYDRSLLIPAVTSYLFFVAGAISHLILDFGFKRTFSFLFKT